MSYDALVLGDGVDGLACAAMLARGGRRVALCGAGARFGGVHAGEELPGGARTAGDSLAWAPPLGLVDALDLARHGWIPNTEHAPTLVSGAGEPLLVHDDAARMAASLGGVGVTRYASFRAKIARWAGALRPLLLDVPPDLRLLSGPFEDSDDSGLAGIVRRASDGFGLARKGLGLRRLGSRDMTDLLRSAPMAVQDLAEDEVDDERLRIRLAATACAGTTLGPRAPGTSATLLLAEILAGPEPLGGPRALVDALLSCARANGVEVRPSTRLLEIECNAGRATAARLATDEAEVRLEADVIVSTLDFATTVLDSIAPAHVPANLERAAQVWKRRGRVAVCHASLAGPITLDGNADHVIHASSLVAMERAADAAKHGRLPDEPWAELRVAPRARAAGHASDAAPNAGDVVTMHIHAVPSTADGEEDALRDAVERSARDILARVAPDASIEAVRTKLPTDLEREHGLAGGHLAGGELILDQLWVQRPALCASRYQTPIEGLWIGGPSSHPGGNLPGGAGLYAARAIQAAT